MSAANDCGVPGPYYLNAVPFLHWEICRGDRVVRSIRKQGDDDEPELSNRSVAEAAVRRLNRAWSKMMHEHGFEPSEVRR